MTLAQDVDEFFISLSPKKLAKTTVEAYRQDVAVIGSHIAAIAGKAWDDLVVDDLDRRAIRRAFAEFSEDHARSSILRAHSTWRQLFDFLVAEGKIEGNPMAAVARPKPEERRPKPLEGWAEDTVARLLSAVAAGNRSGRAAWPERDLAVIATLLATGVRSSELLAMDVGSIEGDAGAQVVTVVGKGSKPRSIPVEGGLDTLLGQYLESRKARYPAWRMRTSDPLFVGTGARTGQGTEKGGIRMTRNQLHYLLDQSLRAAGLSNTRQKGAMAHAFRHTFGTTLAADGAPVSAIRKLMGHSSINTSQGYIDSLAREEREVASRNRLYNVLEKMNDD